MAPCLAFLPFCLLAFVGLTATAASAQDSDSDGLTDKDEVNVYGTWWMTRAAMPRLKESPAGNVVNVTSVAGLRPIGSSTAYGMSKAAVNMLTIDLAKNCKPVRVNAVAPGLVETPWTSDWADLHGAIAAVCDAQGNGLTVGVEGQRAVGAKQLSWDHRCLST